MAKKLSPLSAIKSQAELAKVLKVKERALSTVLRQVPSLYREIEIKRKDGTPRILNAPADDLKNIQRTILDTILITAPVSKCAHGFGKGRSIVNNARLHLGNPYLLNADIKDFFPSIHFSRVHNIFVSLGANKKIAAILTRLTTFDFALPQGAPTSPYLATLALNKLDRRLTELCATNRLTYSRYFDDITISGGDRAHKVLDTVEKIIEDEGYKMHKGSDKLHLSGPADDKLVTGIILKDGKLEPPHVKEILEYISSLQKKGLKALQDDNPLKEQMSLRGKINFIQQVDPEIGLALTQELEKITW